jgi:hypothetical protein
VVIQVITNTLVTEEEIEVWASVGAEVKNLWHLRFDWIRYWSPSDFATVPTLRLFGVS